MQIRIFITLILITVFCSCREARITEHEEWGAVYKKHGIENACFILRDNNHEAIHFYNKERCLKRFLPASTFKIFNSLVALETALAPDERLLIKWDSTTTGRTACDKDLTMQEAFSNSCVWYYREIARRIGPERMKHYVDTVKYGNMNASGSIDNFWLNDSLQISADEQAGFIKRMYFAELPFSERSQRIVKNMMLQEDTEGYKLYYKTGTGVSGDKNVYWITGFIERIKHVKEPKGSMNKVDIRNYPYFFSMNFEKPATDASKDWFSTRIDVLKEILKDYGAMPK